MYDSMTNAINDILELRLIQFDAQIHGLGFICSRDILTFVIIICLSSSKLTCHGVSLTVASIFAAFLIIL